jgi:flagellar hook-associated protein 1 FlgK
LTGDGYVGQGVNVTNIARSYDQFITKQLNSSLSAFGDVDTYQRLATRIDNLMADPNTGIAPVMNNFFNAVNEVANDPTSIPSRQVLLSNANNLSQSLNTMNSQFESIRTQNNNDMGARVNDINSLARSIADINVQIAAGMGKTQGLKQPNDLLDKQDALVSKLAEIVNVSVVHQTDGTSSVFIGNGQALVLKNGASEFTAFQSQLDPSKMAIGINTATGMMDITTQISGGSLGGALRFRDEVLDPAQQQLGRVAAGLAMNINALHKSGYDMSGNSGVDLFSGIAAVPVFSNPQNNGSAVVTANFQDVNIHPLAAANLDYSDFNLKYVNAGGGVDYTLTRIRDNQVINLTATDTVPPTGVYSLSFAATQPANFDRSTYSMASTVSPGIFTQAVSDGVTGPFTLTVDGLQILNKPAGVVGDKVTKGDLDTALTAFLATGPGAGYSKTGSFSNNDLVLSKLDGTAISLAIGSNFSTPGSFSGQINGLASSPAGIDIKVDLTAGKTISVGDELLIRPTYAAAQKIGVNITDPGKIAAATNVEIDPVTKLPVSIIKGPMPSDNRNALKLADLQNSLGMVGGKATFNDAYGQIVSGVGTLTQSAQLSSSAQQTLLNQSKGAREGLAGVNLDEEAANLIKFQQAYQASAQSIAVVKSLFDTFISAVR